MHFVHHIRTQSRAAWGGKEGHTSALPPISVCVGGTCLGDGCMPAAPSREVCLQLSWVPGSSPALWGHLFCILFFLWSDVPSPWGLWGVAREGLRLLSMHPCGGGIGYYSFQFGRAPRNSSCRNIYLWNDLKITRWQPEVYIKLEDKDVEGIKHTTLPASESQGAASWWCYSSPHCASPLHTTTLCSWSEGTRLTAAEGLLLPWLGWETPMPLENILLVHRKWDPREIQVLVGKKGWLLFTNVIKHSK